MKFETVNDYSAAVADYLVDEYGDMSKEFEINQGEANVAGAIINACYESGESINNMVMIPEVTLKGMNDFQSFGSGVTYYRRYALSSALGLVTDIDNDASGEQIKKVKKAGLTDSQFNKAVQAIADGTYTKEELIEKFELTGKQLKTIEQ